MSKILQNTFLCSCGFEEDLEKDLLEISDHMQYCNQFMEKSPLTSILKKNQLEKLKYEELLVLYADLYAQMIKVDSLIEDKRKQTNQQRFPLKNYACFVKEEPEYKQNKKVKIQQTVQNTCKFQQTTSEEEDQEDQPQVVPEIFSNDSSASDDLQENKDVEENKKQCSYCNQEQDSSNDKYFSQENKSIRLNCGHNLCRNCIVYHYREPSSKFLACPMEDCKMPIPLQRLHEAALGKQNTCLLCMKTFISKSNMERHVIQIHSQGKRFGCPQCQISFNTHKLVQYHLMSKHAKVQKKLE